MTTVTPTDVVAEKALRLLDQNRVHYDEHRMVMVVSGDTGRWIVKAEPRGVFCSCPAGGNGDPVSCSHKVAAAISWAES